MTNVPLLPREKKRKNVVEPRRFILIAVAAAGGSAMARILQSGGRHCGCPQNHCESARWPVRSALAKEQELPRRGVTRGSCHGAARCRRECLMTGDAALADTPSTKGRSSSAFFCRPSAGELRPSSRPSRRYFPLPAGRLAVAMISAPDSWPKCVWMSRISAWACFSAWSPAAEL